MWLLDVTRKTTARLTATPFHNSAPHWSPDGSRILFASSRDGQNALYVTDTGGMKQEGLLPKSDWGKGPSSWSADGRFIVYQDDHPKTLMDLWVLPLVGDRKPFPFLQTQFSEAEGALSPDGQWMAYSSDESGQLEVYLRSFPSAENKSQVSTNGGRKPQWRGDGKELFYLDGDRNLVSVDVGQSGSTADTAWWTSRR